MTKVLVEEGPTYRSKIRRRLGSFRYCESVRTVLSVKSEMMMLTERPHRLFPRPLLHEKAARTVEHEVTMKCCQTLILWRQGVLRPGVKGRALSHIVRVHLEQPLDFSCRRIWEIIRGEILLQFFIRAGNNSSAIWPASTRGGSGLRYVSL